MKKSSPNIVFLVLDTHRVDRLGCFGYERGTSPNIDRFAAGATVFEKAVSPAQWTIPAHASMFTGEFPTTHMTVQASTELDNRFRTIAERLKDDGFGTIGFCNNPLVGVLNNGLRRGFDTFYNYGGAIPTLPKREARGWRSISQKIWTAYTQLLRKISYPIQNLIAQSDKFFQLILNPFIVPLWARYAHFKGDTQVSLNDAGDHLRDHTGEGKAPQFVFINLMGTHLPYAPPDEYIDKFAPIVSENREAKEFIRSYNSQAVRWFIPMAEPFSEMEYESLSQMYDAEVAYQDAQLENLLAMLNEPYHQENTMVVIVGDHGEMLGEHQVMGHGLGVYQELIHVPLIMRYPGQKAGGRVEERVSTTYVFQSILDAIGKETYATYYSAEVDISSRSLLSLANGNQNVPRFVFSEAYPAEHVIKTIRSYDASLLEKFRSELTNWAAYENEHKLIHIEEHLDQLFDLNADPREFIQEENPRQLQSLLSQLEDFIARMEARRPNDLTGKSVSIEDDQVVQRLRGLGYLD